MVLRLFECLELAGYLRRPIRRYATVAPFEIMKAPFDYLKNKNHKAVMSVPHSAKNQNDSCREAAWLASTAIMEVL